MKYRITPVTAAFMYAGAILADLAQIFLAIMVFTALVGTLIAVAAMGSLMLWFLINGVNVFGGSKAGTKVMTLVGTTVMEALPFIDALPSITIFVWSNIKASRAEDRLGMA